MHSAPVQQKEAKKVGTEGEAIAIEKELWLGFQMVLYCRNRGDHYDKGLID